MAEDDVRRFSKIKAARTDDHTFTDFDPLVQYVTDFLQFIVPTFVRIDGIE